MKGKDGSEGKYAWDLHGESSQEVTSAVMESLMVVWIRVDGAREKAKNCLPLPLGM